MKKSIPIIAMAAMLLGLFSADAGTLRIGQPQVQGDQITVPVVLEGDVADGVASISFQLNYDPSAVEPQQANPGAAAQSAGKNVMTNVKEPGAYMVVMAGLNSNTIASGEITNIVLQRRSGDASTNISITGTTFASLQGDEIPSRGSTSSISFETAGDEGEQNEEQDTEEQPDNQENPAQEHGAEGTGGSNPIVINPADNEAAARRTPDVADSRQSEGGITQSRQSPVPGESAPETGDDANAKLAEALTVAAAGRANIGARPSDTKDGKQSGGAAGTDSAESAAASEMQMAAMTEDTATVERGEPSAAPADSANVSTAPETSPPSPAITDSALQEPGRPAGMPGTAQAGRTETSARSFTPTLIFVAIAAGAVFGVFVLRRRLFS
ncbi:MAG TPA: cohesin domain-containing protein [Candidatus Hydrogenedentes bacterium]|nr:cohesin domain-containing protein [Candidatus Hydrogenedentota bacterium]HQE83416.1 cohesin domain-containing protein [Candidatus Hydrogenedentota bacterium]HQM50049.1 cohesin domain-containing protein [Candidatus Hydrogenedentota bacterium]